MKKLLAMFALSIFTFCSFCQNETIYPVQVKEKFSNITLTNPNGELINIGESGKKTMLVFIRGKVTSNTWCPICHYQYLEAMLVEEKENIRKKFNMDIYFVMPYKTDSLNNWVEAFPQSIQTIKNWKYPENPSENQKSWAVYAKEFFPYSFESELENLELKLPILFDPDQKVSKGLYLFQEEWGGTKVAQNIPTIFIIDEEGIVRFKYHSQYTNDRPDFNYLIKYMKHMM